VDKLSDIVITFVNYFNVSYIQVEGTTFVTITLTALSSNGMQPSLRKSALLLSVVSVVTPYGLPIIFGINIKLGLSRNINVRGGISLGFFQNHSCNMKNSR